MHAYSLVQMCENCGLMNCVVILISMNFRPCTFHRFPAACVCICIYVYACMCTFAWSTWKFNRK